MDTRTPVQDWPTPSNPKIAKKMPGSDHLAAFKILVIARDQILRVYTDDVLRSAGFLVQSLAPWEARTALQHGGDTFPVIVFSHTLLPEDISELGRQVRRVSPGTKVLLLRGPEPVSFNPAYYDAAMEGLEGPIALIKEVHRLLASSAASDGAAAALA
ncbi:MAG: hypothetical protein WA708_07610 [Acidobacteriaceae bacterium]